MSKTPGQIAYEAGQHATRQMVPALRGDWIAWADLMPELQRCHEITANVIIEECAKALVAAAELEDIKRSAGGPVSVSPKTIGRIEAAQFIRALKSPENDREDKGKSPDGDQAVVNEAPDGSSPSGLPSLLQKIGRVGRWAPGRYWCKCIKCDRQFEGDKRAMHCLPCAIKTIQEDLGAYMGMYNRIVKAFDNNETAQEFLSGDGDDGFPAAIYRMACAIVYLRSQLAKSERDRNPKGGDGEAGSVEDESPVPEGNSPNESPETDAGEATP